MQLDKDGLDDIAAILVSEFTYCGRTKRVWLLRFVGMYVNFEPEAREKSLYGFRHAAIFVSTQCCTISSSGNKAAQMSN